MTLAHEKVVFPDGRCRKPSLSTLKRKLSAYQTCGFDGPARKPRKDRGNSRSAPPDIVEAAIALKKSAFIDCYSRHVVAARYYYRQNLDVLIDTLLSALAVHGRPLGLYLDHAKVYHSTGLKAACYRTGIQLRALKESQKLK